MNTELKTKWIAALRSGEYKQANGYLTLKNAETGELSHCCLGVLCDIAAKEGIIQPGQPTKFDTSLISYGENSTAFPPREVVKAFYGVSATDGFEDEWNVTLPDDSQETLAGRMLPLTFLNDTRKWTFDQIADVIESSLVEPVSVNAQ